MEIAIRVDCSPTEARRLLGQPDLLPLYEVISLAQELTLVALVNRACDAPWPGARRAPERPAVNHVES